MQRRALLAAVAGASPVACTAAVAGCAERTDSADTHTSTPDATPTPDPSPTPQDPADCPTSNPIDVDRPDELDPESVAAFLERYERTYVREVAITRDVDRLEGPSVTVQSVSRHEVGYAAELDVRWATWDTSATIVEAALEDPAGDVTPDPVDAVDHELLRDLAREAVEQDERASREVDGELPVDLQAALDDLPADWDGRYVDVDGTTVRFETSEIELHGDGFHTALYYVDDRVVRRVVDPVDDAAPADGILLECRA